MSPRPYPFRLPLCVAGCFFVRAWRRGGLLAGVLLLALASMVMTACGEVVVVQPPTAVPTPGATPVGGPATVAPRPTVTRALPTATKPNTPTPSPTPIIHVVQSGETLIAIALQYGVTVDALQVANGITDPAALQINQELIIPVGQESEAQDPNALLPSPTPADISVEGLGCYDEPVGSLWCLGEIVNSTTTSIENARLRVALHDDAGNELANAEVQVALDIILSGQRAPFGILFRSPPEGYSRFSAVPIRAESSSEPAQRYAELGLEDVDAEPVGLLFQVSGRVTNPGQQVVTSVILVVTTYDAAGQVTSFRRSQVTGELLPGGAADFGVTLMPNKGTPAHYSLGVQGRLPTP
jgi:LysM repeat protein